jgi:hypothetical protein
VAVILETVTLGASRREWQGRIQTFQRFQRMIVGAVVCNRCSMALKDGPSASSRINLARNTYPAGKERV